MSARTDEFLAKAEALKPAVDAAEERLREARQAVFAAEEAWRVAANAYGMALVAYNAAVILDEHPSLAAGESDG